MTIYIVLGQQIWPVWAESVRIFLRTCTKFDLKELRDSSGGSETRNRAIQSCAALSTTAEDIESSIRRHLRAYMLSEVPGKSQPSKSAARNLRKLVHSIMFITLNIMVSRKVYNWFEFKTGEAFDPEMMQSVGGLDSPHQGQVLFTVQNGLRLVEVDGKSDGIVCKARVIVKSKVSRTGTIAPLKPPLDILRRSEDREG
jgi:hypothetical protein